MLIIEVALGIVVAVLILSYLREILAVSLILGIITIILGVMGIALIFAIDVFSFATVAAIAITIPIAYLIIDDLNLLKHRWQRQKKLPKLPRGGTKELEKKRRELLGYDD
ncbi:MAG TPA: hypothetical protein PK347_14450 [Burkholderiaceae bacterium]|nr:hypothetical protein [Burkholderiaceae bacterium]